MTTTVKLFAALKDEAGNVVKQGKRPCKDLHSAQTQAEKMLKKHGVAGNVTAVLEVTL